MYYSVGEQRNTAQSLDECKTWLRNCNASHVCLPPSKIASEPLPTRLIVIDEGELRLCPDTSGICNATSYASLSHCWGLYKFVTLTKDTLPVFTTRIESKDLHKTFREAINIARFLGFKYIWIDSLCIIQDDAEDWKRESVRMGAVYGRSGLNIAATSASDGRIGCFFDRQVDWRSQILLGSGDSRPQFYECFTPELLEPYSYEVPLMSRAWVVQERFLSPRTLHFTKHQIFWVCRSLTACEVWPQGIPRVQRYLKCSLDLPEGSNWLSRSGWPTIVEQYSSCKLTMGREKLVAISAIAQLIQSSTPDDYIAGMWRSDLAAQLCWSVSKGQRITPAVAPTWSWASNSAPISYFNSEPYTTAVTKEYVHIHHLDLDLLTPSNPFGEILSGTLELRCEYLKECTVYGPGAHSGIVIDDQRALRGGVIREPMGFDSSEDYAGVDVFRAFWLPVVRTSPGGTDRHSGIVLQQTDARKGEYIRIGSASIQKSGNSDHRFPSEPFLPRDEDCARVEIDEEGTKQYFLYVV